MTSEAVSGNSVAKKPRPAIGGWLKNPKKERVGETIGGGWFVFRRGGSTGRIRPSMWPFEYGSEDAAADQASQLARDHPGQTFIVVGQVRACLAPALAEAA